MPTVVKYLIHSLFGLIYQLAEDFLLILGLNSGGTLFRHEIAFVLGQLAEPVSVPALRAALADLSQHEMVRHECAEALGAVATTDCLEVIYVHPIVQ